MGTKDFSFARKIKNFTAFSEISFVKKEFPPFAVGKKKNFLFIILSSYEKDVFDLKISCRKTKSSQSLRKIVTIKIWRILFLRNIWFQWWHYKMQICFCLFFLEVEKNFAGKKFQIEKAQFSWRTIWKVEIAFFSLKSSLLLYLLKETKGMLASWFISLF